jgi:hypothetical protein
MKLSKANILLAVVFASATVEAFVPRQLQQHGKFSTSTQRFVSSDVDEIIDDVGTKSGSSLPQKLRISGRSIPARNSKIQLLDTSTYEASLINQWDNDPTRQKGFDWEIEKLRRYSAGLRMREDGSWVKEPSFFDFLITKQRVSSLGSNSSPSAVNVGDVAILMTTNVLSSLGFGPTLGMAAVPTAVIQKYEGSFFSFIKGALGGDLQTLAGGPLFLLLAKYFEDYGPIFNLSFGPKSFLVISDPVMAKHILRTAPPDQYCKGMLADILEPIMQVSL